MNRQIIRMKKIIFLTLAALTVMFTQAQTIKTVDSKITDVTVFLSGAQVTHEASLALKAGDNTFKIENLTANLDPNSIQVEGNPNYTILSVRHQVNYMTAQNPTPEIKAVMDSLEQVQSKLKSEQTMRDVYNDELALIRANKDIKGTNVILLPEDLLEMADFFRERMTEIQFRILDIGKKEKKYNEEIQRLQNTLNNMNARRGQNPSEIVVKVDGSKATTTTLKLSYTTWSAGWFPVYDLRSEEIDAPIDLVYKAKVYQSTGSDWKGVNLVVSTGNPSAGGQSPLLNPWYIYVYNPQPITTQNYGRTRDEKAAQAPSAYGGIAESMDATGYSATLADYNSVQQNAVNVEFKIGVPFDIPSDNQQYDVELQRSGVKAEYEYIIIPKLDNDAFLRARLTDWAQYNLLAGESNIYFKGTFVGKGYIDPALANDTLNLSLGRDKGLIVKREQLSDYCKTSSFAGKNKTTKAYEITVINNKKKEVPITIEDQFPISQTSEIEVEIEENSGGSYDPVTGKITWTQKIKAGETVKKEIRFNVKYPKKKYVAGL